MSRSWGALETLQARAGGPAPSCATARLTLALAILGAGGRIVVPILMQQSIDKGYATDGVDVALITRFAVIGAVVIMVCSFAMRAAVVRLARRSEHALYGLRTRAFAHIHALSIADHAEERRGSLVGPGHLRHRDALASSSRGAASPGCSTAR